MKPSLALLSAKSSSVALKRFCIKMRTTIGIARQLSTARVCPNAARPWILASRASTFPHQRVKPAIQRSAFWTLPGRHVFMSARSLWETEIGRTYAKVRGTRKKWGYVVYRTTYLNDEEWERVKQIIIQKATQGAAGIPDLMKYMEWIFVDDKATLDGVSRASLRQRFRGWAAETARGAGYDDPEYSGGHSRLVFFLEVDEESLRSIIDGTFTDDVGLTVGGHINVVDSQWEPDTKEFNHEEDRLADLEWQKLMEPIDGCREVDVGWKKMEADLLTPEFQDELDWLMEGTNWHRMYTRPPWVDGQPEKLGLFSEEPRIDRIITEVIAPRFASVASSGRHWRPVVAGAERGHANIFPDGPWTRTPAVRPIFWMNVWDDAQGLPAGLEHVTPRSEDLRQPSARVMEAIASKLGPDELLMAQEGVDQMMGRIEVFRNPMGGERFAERLRLAKAGRGEGAAEIFVRMQQLVAVFTCVNHPEAIRRMRSEIADIERQLDIIERNSPEATGLTALWGEFWPHYFGSVSARARGWLTSNIGTFRREMLEEAGLDEEYRDTILLGLESFEKSIPVIHYPGEERQDTVEL